MSASSKYYAFISYSRKDSKAAAWLQKRLEWFRFPVKLVPADRRPPNARYVRPIYRDKTNLENTDEHYWLNIRRALEESRYLIVLCSPHAAISEPVNLEVAHFLETHSGDASLVVPVIVSGHVTSAGPDAALCPALLKLGDLIIGRNLPTMVPDAVTAEQDAWEAGFVSLVSYLLRLERTALGDHIQRETLREAKEKARVLRRWLVAVGMLTVLAAASAWLALNAKREVERANVTIVGKNKEITSQNQINLQNLHEASMADYAVAVQRIEKDGNWHEGVAHLVRALKWEPSNPLAAARLHSTLSLYASEKRTWPVAILRHTGTVFSAQFSTDGTRVLTVSADNAARVWEKATGALLGKPLRHEGEVWSAQFSPDGAHVVTACSDHIARIWDAASGALLIDSLRHQEVVNSAMFSPDGTRVVTASDDNTAKIWDAATGTLLAEPLLHQKGVKSARFSPDGARIVTASDDNTARIWNAATGKALGKPLRHDDAVNTAEFSADGTCVVTASSDNTARVWDCARGKILGEPLRHDYALGNVRFSPDDTRIVTTSQFLERARVVARLWDAKTCKVINQPRWDELGVTCAEFSSDGMYLVIAGSHGLVQVCDAASGVGVGEPLRHAAGVTSVHFSDDGQLIVTASEDGTARIWSAATRRFRGEPLCRESDATTAEFSANGARVITKGDDSVTRVWDVATAKPIGEPLPGMPSILSAHLNADGTRVVTAATDNAVRVWSVDTGEMMGVPLRHDGALKSASFTRDGSRIVTASRDHTARVWSASTGVALCGPLRHDNDVLSAQSNAQGTRIVSASEDTTARIWDAFTGSAIGKPLRHEGAIREARFSSDSTRIVTGSEDKTARIWDASTGEAIDRPLRHEDTVLAAQFSADGTRILTVSGDQLTPRVARLWDTKTGAPVGQPLDVVDVLSAQFSFDGTLIVTAGGHTARVWDALTGKPVGEPFLHSDVVVSAYLSPDARRVITGCHDHTVRFWDTAQFLQPPIPVPEWMLGRADAIAGIKFDPEGKLREIAPEARLAMLSTLPPGTGEWPKLVRWLLQPEDERTLSPDSKFTSRQIAERERDSGFKEGIESALRYDPTVPLAHVLLARFDENPQRADFLRGFGLRLLPEDAGLWERAVRTLHEQKDEARTRQALVKLEKLDRDRAAAVRKEIGL